MAKHTKAGRRLRHDPVDSEIVYALSGVSADINQMIRAYLRYDKQQKVDQLAQIIQKLRTLQGQFY